MSQRFFISHFHTFTHSHNFVSSYLALLNDYFFL